MTFVVGPDGRIEQAIVTKDPAGQAGALLEVLKPPV
jgi:peroxiredoxin